MGFLNSQNKELLSTEFRPFLFCSNCNRSLKQQQGKIMAAKKGKTNGKDLLQQQDIVQAVIVADSFDAKFLPLTKEKPKVLLPLVNKILLDYALEALEGCGIQETFVFCSYRSQQIRNYISDSKWSSTDATMSVTVISSETFLSLGDVLRELDAKALIRSDFILMNGDVITTLPLLNILEKHKKCRQKDKGSAMTMICRQVLPKHKSRCREDEVVIAVEAHTNKIRYYQKIRNMKTLCIPLEVFQESSEVTIRFDLLDCHISICSPAIPPLYSDNFDFQTRDDLIKGLLINEEILGNSVYLHLAENDYGASVSNLFMYDAVSQDIVRRWTYPIVPDAFILNGSKCSHLRHNIYKQSDVHLGRGCILHQNVVIGKGTSIGNNAFITNSVIGKNCHIGENVRIEGAYLWDNVSVGDNCILKKCLLAENVGVQENVSVSVGCVLSYEVIIGANTNLPDFTILQAEPYSEESDFGDDEPEEDQEGKKSEVCDSNIVGEGGKGFPYTAASISDSEEADICQDIWGQIILSDEETDEENASSDESGISEQLSDRTESPVPDDTKLFYNEVFDSLLRGVEEKVKSENLILEINSSKYAYNVTMKEVNTLVMKAIFKIPQQKQKQSLSSQEYFVELKPILINFIPLIQNYIKNPSSQMECLLALEEFLIANEDLIPTIIKILHLLYENDILNENVIFKWYGNPLLFSEDSSVNQEKIRKHVTPFIKWLKEAEEESADDSED